MYRGLIGSSLEKLGWQQTERSRAKVGFYRLTPSRVRVAGNCIFADVSTTPSWSKAMKKRA